MPTSSMKKSALMKQLRNKAVEQTMLCSPLWMTERRFMTLSGTATP
jgi:hypothetical protein